MGYDIGWIIPRLRNPGRLWYCASSITVAVVGLFSKIIVGASTHQSNNHPEQYPRHSNKCLAIWKLSFLYEYSGKNHVMSMGFLASAKCELIAYEAYDIRSCCTQSSAVSLLHVSPAKRVAASFRKAPTISATMPNHLLT